MSIEAYENLKSRYELYGLLQDGIDDIRNGKTKPFDEAMAELRSRRKRFRMPSWDLQIMS